jgi:hypothetical protein
VGSNTYDFEKVSQSAAWVKAINGDHDHDQYVQQLLLCTYDCFCEAIAAILFCCCDN